MENHSIKTILEATVYDKYGNVKNQFSTENKPKIGDEVIINKYDNKNINIDTIKMPFKSWNMNFIPLIMKMKRDGQVGIFVALNDLTPSDVSYAIPLLNGNINNADSGIWVGTGSGSMTSISESNLKNKISHGTGTGQLIYSQTWTDPIFTNDVGGYTTKHKRMFTNNSGNTITIRETGIFANNTYYVSGMSNIYFTSMFARDAEDYDGNPLSIELADTQVAEINYFFSIDSGSFLNKNFMNLLNSCMNGSYYNAGHSNPALITVTSSSLQKGIYIANLTAPEGISSYGLVVGTGTDAINMEHYSMSAKINHGTGNNELYHYVTEVWGSIRDYQNNTVSSIVQRNFSNYSTSSITVKEVGLYGYGGGSDSNRLMWGRALTSGTGVTIDVSESVQFRFIFSSSLS